MAHLKSITLSGFKSFADTISIPFGPLTGIVGPNGCGKSNLVDAIQWVIGESSAKRFRSECMADVIFRGSQYRRAAHYAFVELILDNNFSKIGGYFKAYSEISIRRQITQDGQSTYFINGTKCRRRDVIDLFLGTGLGSHSCAIVQQGTISRLIEAKPQELYQYFEEIAQVSKSKHRLQETQNKMAETRDHLARLFDLQQELLTRRDHLADQARIAQQYHQLKKELDIIVGTRLTHLWHEANQAEKTHTQNILTLEIQIARLFAEKQRSELDQLQHEESKRQAEQEMITFQQSLKQLEIQQHRAQEHSISVLHQKEALQHQHDLLTQQSVGLEQKIKEKNIKVEELKRLIQVNFEEKTVLQDQLKQAEKAYHNQKFLLEQKESQQNQQEKVEQEKTQKLATLEKEIHYLQESLEQQENTCRTFQAQLLSSESADFLNITFLTEQQQILQQAIERLEQEMTIVQTQRKTLQNELAQLSEEEQRVQKQLEACTADYQRLQLFHSMTLGKQSTALNDWLLQQGLDKVRRLGEDLSVTPGWERAVEIVLGPYFQALCIPSFKRIAAWFTNPIPAPVTFLATEFNWISTKPSRGELLLSKIQSPWSLEILLGGVYCAETFEEALVMRKNLSPSESVITREGIWVSSYWIRSIPIGDLSENFLEKQEHLKVLLQQKQTLESRLTTIQTQQKELQILVDQLALQQKTLEVQLIEGRAQLKALEAERKSKEQWATQQIQQNERITSSLTQHQNRLADLEGQLTQKLNEQKEARQDLEEYLHTRPAAVAVNGVPLSTFEQERQKLRKQLMLQEHQTIRLSEQLKGLEKQWNEQEYEKKQLAVQLHDVSNRLIMLTQEGQGKQEAYESQKARYETAHTAYATAEEAYRTIDHAMSELLKQQQVLQRQLERHQKQLGEHQAQQQLNHGKKQVLEQQMSALAIDWEAAVFDATQIVSELENKIESLQRQLDALGLVNLAAVSEFEALDQRYHYLENQIADVHQALEELSKAIQFIHQVAQEQFQKTYQQVNQLYQTLFPKIFDGGEAYLQLINETSEMPGILIKAQPPGKRNSTIESLSGGEKALAAIALIFALFQYNPAPFCFLDEVDAPLDDNNVEKLSRLFKEMSEKFQLLFISHHKTSLSGAQHLLGITMKEPGVSRVVSVNLDQAIELAEVVA